METLLLPQIMLFLFSEKSLFSYGGCHVGQPCFCTVACSGQNKFFFYILFKADRHSMFFFTQLNRNDKMKTLKFKQSSPNDVAKSYRRRLQLPACSRINEPEGCSWG